MKIQGSGIAGTTESGDALVIVEPAGNGIELDLFGPSIPRYGEEIEAAIRSTLGALDIKAARVRLQEKGALDCTIKARLIAACGRAAGDASGAARGSDSVPWEAMP